LLTLHRPSNVDDPVVLERILGAVVTISTRLPIIFPVHPRTAARLESTGLDRRLGPRILRMPPLRYLDMLGLLSKARVVLTDSGGVQEETTALGVACLTLRENTERPITVTAGTNTVVGTDPQAILAAFDELQRSGGKGGQIPPLWDGHAAERIAAEILRWARERRGTGGGPTASAPFREGEREHG
jgi:UDP-N-acetylglucosamine 2-epimerase (non-hydrolysing)